MMLANVLKHSLTGKKRVPLDLIVHVTNRCNAKCQTCFTWENLNSGKKDLTLEEYEKISRQLPDLLWLSISGGEPFLREDLPEICEIFYRNSRPSLLGIPSNGLLPAKVHNAVRKILKKVPIPVTIDISIDGLYERHDEIRGVKGNFDRSLETYRELASLKREFRHLSIKVISVINNKNYDQLENMNGFVRHAMPEVNYHSYIFLRGSSPCKDVVLPSPEDLRKKKDFLLRASDDYRGNGNMPWLEKKMALIARRYLLDINLETLRRKEQVIPCLAGKYHGVISADGDVSLCELMHTIGNLRDVDFDFNSLWLSPKAERLRRSIEQKQCVCTHECAQFVNVILNRDNYFPLIKLFVRDLLGARN